LARVGQTARQALWFALGGWGCHTNDAKLEHNTLFKDGQYEEALSKYILLYQLCLGYPNLLNYGNFLTSAHCYCYLDIKKYDDAIKECTKTLELNLNYISVLLRRAEACEKLEQFEETIADMTKVLEVDPSYDQARR
ncbi:unnamed protein product, partial [Coffea canephora]